MLAGSERTAIVRPQREDDDLNERWPIIGYDGSCSYADGKGQYWNATNGTDS